MAMYFEGYAEARREVQKMNEQKLLDYIDSLFGRENLPESFTLEQLRNEALAQCRREFTDTTSAEYETVDFYTRLHAAMKANKGE